MDNRKEIIIKEIQYWRENKLLPEQYCNFLLALYTEGDSSQNRPSNQSRQGLVFVLSFLIFLGAVVTYFTELSFSLQTSLYALILLSQFVLTNHSRRKLNFTFPLTVLLLVALFVTVDTVTYWLRGNNVALMTAVLFNCCIWYIVGKRLRLIYFKAASILGIIFLMILLFR